MPRPRRAVLTREISLSELKKARRSEKNPRVRERILIISLANKDTHAQK